MNRVALCLADGAPQEHGKFTILVNHGEMRGKQRAGLNPNVFQALGLPNTQEHLVKAQLVLRIDRLMKARRLKQSEAATLFGITQPDVSKMLRGSFRQFSVERLMRFLVALDQDVEIVIRPHRDPANAPQLRVA